MREKVKAFLEISKKIREKNTNNSSWEIFFNLGGSQRKWEKVWKIFINWKWMRENSREKHEYLSKYNNFNHIILLSYSLFQYSFCICLFFLFFLIHFLPFCKLFYVPGSQNPTFSACANLLCFWACDRHNYGSANIAPETWK